MTAVRRRLGPVVLALLLVATAPQVAVGPAGAVPVQDGEAPSQDIIPEPNSGREPEEAGDRGGALQLAILGLVVAAILGGGTYVALQARRARYSASSERIASQADTPSRKPAR